MERTYVEPFKGPLSEFPKDLRTTEGVKTVTLKDRLGLRATIHANVVYDRKDDVDLHLQILVPWSMEDYGKTWPLIVFIPGSAWMKQAVYHVLPQMIRMCERGFVVAVVEYRHSGLTGFPAQAEDAKTAIRFMKLHAEEYFVNTEQVIVWGDSSGGHTALMAGFTADSYPDNGTYGDISCKVNCIVDWYGPTELIEMNSFPSAMDHSAPASPEGRLIGFRNVLDNPEDAAKASPISYINAETDIPPLLIMHGNRDQLVCYDQSLRLYEKMKSLGKDVQMICLNGAYHGSGGFQSDEALDLVEGFIREKRLVKET